MPQTEKSHETIGIIRTVVVCTLVLDVLVLWNDNRLISRIDLLNKLMTDSSPAQQETTTCAPCRSVEVVVDMEIRAKVMAIIVQQIGVDEKEVTEDASFVDDLDADWPDMVELIMAFEDEFDLEIRDGSLDEIQYVWEAVDYVSRMVSPPRIEGPFLMPIEDVFSTAQGTMVTGWVDRGKVTVGEAVEVVGLREVTGRKTVTRVDVFRMPLKEGVAGKNIGVLLDGTNKDDVERGQVLAEPGSITPHTVFRGDLYLITPDLNGRRSAIYSGYRPQFYLRTTDVYR